MSLVPLLREGDDKPKTLIADIYRAMAANGIAPNIYTFNAAFHTAATLRNNRIAIDFARNMLADMAKFNLKPSLTTYYYVLRILSKFGNYTRCSLSSRIFYVSHLNTSLVKCNTGDSAYKNFIQILTSLKQETLVIQDERDTNFFVTAMEMASRQFCDRQAGEMVNELLLNGDNYKFIGDNYRVSIIFNP